MSTPKVQDGGSLAGNDSFRASSIARSSGPEERVSGLHRGRSVGAFVIGLALAFNRYNLSSSDPIPSVLFVNLIETSGCSSLDARARIASIVSGMTMAWLSTM